MRWLTALLYLILFPVSVLAVEEALLTPSDAFVLAYADAEMLTPDVAKCTRYIWLPNLSVKDRTTFKVIIDAHCNQLSRETDLVPTRAVKDTNGHLLAVNIHDYGWKSEIWDLFLETDHTFYASVTVVTEVLEVPEKWYRDPDTNIRWGYNKKGEVIREGTKTKTSEKSTRVLAPWLIRTPGQKRAVEGLAALTYCKAPVVNAFVFIDNAASAGDGRSPSYYDFLGIKTEADFQRLIGAEVEKDVAFATDLLAAVGLSGVTQEPRAIQRISKRGGAYWRSFDVNRGTAKDKKNALRVLSSKNGKLQLDFDVSEQYGHLPNSLFAFLLVNDKGAVQDRAPDVVATSSDSFSVLRNNHSVKICVSCVGCHIKGLQDVDDWFRNFPPELDILAGDQSGKKYTDYEDVKRLRQQYKRKLEPFIKKDRDQYAEALLEITGLKPEKYASTFIEVWVQAADTNVDIAYASRELGVKPEVIIAAVRHQVAQGKADPVLAQFALPVTVGFPPVQKRKLIPLSSWREAYPLMQQYLAEVK